MKSRRFILLGAGLAFGAAFANVGVALRTGTSVSHLTGDVSRLSLDLARAWPIFPPESARVAVAVLMFILGAVTSGLLIHHTTLDFARPYGQAVAAAGLLFLGAAWLFDHGHIATGIGAAAFACGFQNALATRYRGLILRTTHLTGLLTDFGTNMGLRLRGSDIPRWKLLVPALLAISFFLGGLSAASMFFVVGYDPVFLAGWAYVAIGMIWFFRNFFRPRFSSQRKSESRRYGPADENRPTIPHGPDGRSMKRL